MIDFDTLEECDYSYYSGGWFKNNGPEQSAHFASLLTSGLPDSVKSHIQKTTETMVDFGCATGDGTAIFHYELNPNGTTRGVDIAPTAIYLAKKRFPMPYLSFGSAIIDKPDTLVTSNCLEHFTKPQDMMNVHFKNILKWYIILVPWQEGPNLIPGHRHSFEWSSFPEAVDVKDGTWVKFFSKKFPPDDNFWGGEQICVIYKKAEF